MQKKSRIPSGVAPQALAKPVSCLWINLPPGLGFFTAFTDQHIMVFGVVVIPQETCKRYTEACVAGESQKNAMLYGNFFWSDHSILHSLVLVVAINVKG